MVPIDNVVDDRGAEYSIERNENQRNHMTQLRKTSLSVTVKKREVRKRKARCDGQGRRGRARYCAFEPIVYMGWAGPLLLLKPI